MKPVTITPRCSRIEISRSWANIGYSKNVGSAMISEMFMGVRSEGSFRRSFAILRCQSVAMMREGGGGGVGDLGAHRGEPPPDEHAGSEDPQPEPGQPPHPPQLQKSNATILSVFAPARDVTLTCSLVIPHGSG